MPQGLPSPFTFEERKWIILKFGELKSATQVRRAFQKQFPKSNPRDVPNRMQFHMPWTQILSRRCAALPHQDLKKYFVSELKTEILA